MTDFALPTRPPQLAIERWFGSTISSQICVFHAVILHDIKARFFGNGWGYVITIFWPFLHIGFIVASHALKGKTIPYGESAILYAVTGAVPYIIWMYLSRFTMMGVLSNKSFLQYPVVKTLDLILARQMLELMSGTIVLFMLMLVLYALQIDFWPKNMHNAIGGLAGIYALGIGFGVMNGQIVRWFPAWNFGYTGVRISFYLLSGAVIIQPEDFPNQYSWIFGLNPLLNVVEWFRSGFYSDYPTTLMSGTYVYFVAGGTLLIGLLIDRVSRYF